MKTASAITVTKVELTPPDARLILWEVMKKDSGAVENIILQYLKKRGASVAKIQALERPDLDFNFMLHIEGEPEKVKGYFPQDTGYIRTNSGFYKWLKLYLDGCAGRKSSYTDALNACVNYYPGMTGRKFDIYIRDKHQQKTKHFAFDNAKKILKATGKSS